MQYKTILSVLSVAIVAYALPNPAPASGATTPTCNAPSTLACCDSFAKNGTGVGCIFSTLNILNPTCTSGSSLACCSAPQTGLINIECVPINIVL